MNVQKTIVLVAIFVALMAGLAIRQLNSDPSCALPRQIAPAPTSEASTS